MKSSAASGQERNRAKIEALFDSLSKVLPFRYAQWLVEDPQTHDYRVTAARFPADASCYDIAHRTGVIGQVFRLRRTLLVEAAQAHPLYDPYDPAVEWELTVPLFLDTEIAAVLNLEGEGKPDLTLERWEALRAQVTEMTSRETPPSLPGAGDDWKLDTEWFQTRQLKGGSKEALSLARAVAQTGVWTLVAAGTRRDVQRPLAECIQGDSPYLDLFLPGKDPSVKELEDLRVLLDGRYQMVILP